MRTTLLLLAGLAAPLAAQQTAGSLETLAAAEVAATQFLNLLQQREYGVAFERTGPEFRARVQRWQFESYAKSHERFLTRSNARVVVARQYQLDGAPYPRGEVVQLHFRTTLDAGADQHVFEEVTLHRPATDGPFRVFGYQLWTGPQAGAIALGWDRRAYPGPVGVVGWDVWPVVIPVPAHPGAPQPGAGTPPPSPPPAPTNQGVAYPRIPWREKP